MLLEIDDSKTIAELQDRFTTCFPYLRIEFYRKAHHWREASQSEERISSSEKVGDVRKTHDPGVLQIKSFYQAGRVEKDFKALFGLNAQVYNRFKTGDSELAENDKLTLQEMSKVMK